MKRVGVGAPNNTAYKAEKKEDSKLKKEVKELREENQQLKKENELLREENQQLKEGVAPVQQNEARSPE